MNEKLEALTKSVADLETRASEALATVGEDSTSEQVAEVKALISDEIKPEIDRLRAERADLERKAETKAVQDTLSDLQSSLEDLRKPMGTFSIGPAAEDEGKGLGDSPYGTGEYSVFADIHFARQGDKDARERLAADDEYARSNGFNVNPQGKAMTEGTNSQGGYLVRAAIERQLVLAKESDNVLRGLCSKLNINTNAIQLDQLGITTSAGWVAELATKPESTAMTLASITANVFTAAGLATISNQLLADSNPAVDQLATADLVKRLVALEEVAFINGTGTNQPLGILGTPGLGATNLTGTGVTTTGGLLDAILDAVASIQSAWGQPSAILMHPRTWTRVLKDKDANGHYTIGQPTLAGYPDPTQARTVATSPGIPHTLFGVPVVLSNRVPTNLGAGTNESRVIVGDFREALILDRQGITVDESPHVYFTSNQTVFRAEERVGFTAARSPAAFNVIGGVGLVNG